MKRCYLGCQRIYPWMMIWYQEAISGSGLTHGYVQHTRPPSWNLFLGKLSLGWLWVKSWPNGKLDLGIQFIMFCLKSYLCRRSYFVLKASLNQLASLFSLESANTSSQEFTWLKKPVKSGFASRLANLYICDVICVKHVDTMTSDHQLVYQDKPLVSGLEMPWYRAEACKSWAKGCCLYITGGSQEVAGVSWYYDVVQYASLRFGIKLTLSPTLQVQWRCCRHDPHGFQWDSTTWCGRYDT